MGTDKAQLSETWRLVIYERNKQDAKWGEQNHNALFWLGILTEELGEVAKGIIENDPWGYRQELIHVAAVAVAAIESYARNQPRDVKDDMWKAQS